MPFRRLVALCLFALTYACAAGPNPDDLEGGGRGGAGVVLRRGAVTYVGNAGFCSRPATIDLGVVEAATPEWRELRREGVTEGSARHALLKARMHDRIVAASRKVALATGNDLVVRSGDVQDARSLVVEDLTRRVSAEL
ncbi:MAG: hypothetical protein JNL08_04760 [Planctomycetes bacterium]|nr:hypothetical protein [Planctomycetota bacterium]